MTTRPQGSRDVLAQARRNARIEENFSRGGYSHLSVKDHILPSLCTHDKEENDEKCQRCLFDKLPLPELPEMVFPHNKLVISFKNKNNTYIEFNAYDALNQVVTGVLPDIQVAPSVVWQATRQNLGSGHSHPFDWTYTTNYNGTLVGCSTEPTTETINLDKLKQQDEIGFYSQVTLYEDELADHGCAELTVRLRVMPKFFFALMRFYLRVDKVLIRVCDTRLVGDNNSEYIIREWSRREAKIEELSDLPSDFILDSNRVWTVLPVIDTKTEKIIPLV